MYKPIFINVWVTPKYENKVFPIVIPYDSQSHPMISKVLTEILEFEKSLKMLEEDI